MLSYKNLKINRRELTKESFFFFSGQCHFHFWLDPVIIHGLDLTVRPTPIEQKFGSISLKKMEFILNGSDCHYVGPIVEFLENYVCSGAK